VNYLDASWETIKNTLSQLNENGHEHLIDFMTNNLFSPKKITL
jgi:hypothetical protein